MEQILKCKICKKKIGKVKFEPTEEVKSVELEVKCKNCK